jgi:MFS family permease
VPVPRAQAATAVLFALTGLVASTWAVRIPAVQERLDLSPARLGLALLALEAGAVAGLPLGGVLVARSGSVACVRVAVVLFPAALVAIALAPGLAALALFAALNGAANSVLDVALNGQGVELERRAGRPLLGGLHAGHGAGLLAGALVALGAAAAGVAVLAHVAAVAAASALVGLLASRSLVDDGWAPAREALVRPGSRLLLLGVVAIAAFAIEGIASSWAAVHLRSDHGAGPALATAGYTAFVAALAAGRLGADRLLARHGSSRVVAAGGLLAAAGSALVVLAPGVLPAMAGWLVVGLAVAPLAPALLGAAPGLGDRPAAAALAAVSTVGYLGGLAGPPAVGLLAGPLSLSGALALLVLASLAVAALARPALRPAPRATRAGAASAQADA